MNTTMTVKAFYCGIEVEIICQMNPWSLIRVKGRSFVLDATDLVLEQSFNKTTKAANRAWAA